MDKYYQKLTNFNKYEQKINQCGVQATEGSGPGTEAGELLLQRAELSEEQQAVLLQVSDGPHGGRVGW